MSSAFVFRFVFDGRVSPLWTSTNHKLESDEVIHSRQGSLVQNGLSELGTERELETLRITAVLVFYFYVR